MNISSSKVAPVLPPKRSALILYSNSVDPYSHRVRIVLAEKGVEADIFQVDKDPRAKQALIDTNPYGGVPTLIDRDLIVYQPDIMMEYLDERFPHPPLMPIYPAARARTRLMIYRINRDWFTLMDKLLVEEDLTHKTILRKKLADSLTSVAPHFSEMPYFFGEEFSLVDCCLLPLLWRLPFLEITLPPQAKPIEDYASRLFQREPFMASLTDPEKELRK